MKLKKFCIIFVISQFFTFSIVSENVKIKIEGPERSYNQVRITNNTSYENFECKVYRLQQKDGKLITSELLGVYNLKEKSKEFHVVLIYFLDSLIEVWQKMKRN